MGLPNLLIFLEAMWLVGPSKQSFTILTNQILVEIFHAQKQEIYHQFSQQICFCQTSNSSNGFIQVSFKTSVYTATFDVQSEGSAVAHTSLCLIIKSTKENLGIDHILSARSHAALLALPCWRFELLLCEFRFLENKLALGTSLFIPEQVCRC